MACGNCFPQAQQAAHLVAALQANRAICFGDG